MSREVFCGTAEQCDKCQVSYLPTGVLEELRVAASEALVPGAVKAKPDAMPDDSRSNHRRAIEEFVQNRESEVLRDVASEHRIIDPYALVATAVLAAEKDNCIPNTGD